MIKAYIYSGYATMSKPMIRGGHSFKSLEEAETFWINQSRFKREQIVLTEGSNPSKISKIIQL